MIIKARDYITLVVLFDPNPRVPGQSDPERSSRGDVGQVVNKRLGGVQVLHGGVQRG